MAEGVRDLLQVFSDQGHSGSSAPYMIELFTKLAKFEPLEPLTGEDSEWNDIGRGSFQNNRCGRVFKDADGRAYDIEGKVFVDPDGTAFTNKDSRVYIDFPYTPKTEYVELTDMGRG